jgi:hypothetical protein
LTLSYISAGCTLALSLCRTYVGVISGDAEDVTTESAAQASQVKAAQTPIK